MSFQTLDPTENAYFYNNILVLNNKNIIEDQRFNQYMQYNFKYVPPQEALTYKTLVVHEKEIWAMAQNLNVLSVYSLDRKYLANTEVFLTDLVSIMTKIIMKSLKTTKIANLVGVKLCVYLPDNKQVPIGFQQDELCTSDFLDTRFEEPLRMHIKTFEYSDNFILKLFPFTDIDENFLTTKILEKLLCKGNESTTQPVPSTLARPIGFTPSTQAQSTIFTPSSTTQAQSTIFAPSTLSQTTSFSFPSTQSQSQPYQLKYNFTQAPLTIKK